MPPITARPPRAMASAMCFSITSTWLGMVIGP